MTPNHPLQRTRRKRRAAERGRSVARVQQWDIFSALRVRSQKQRVALAHSPIASDRDSKDKSMSVSFVKNNGKWEAGKLDDADVRKFVAQEKAPDDAGA